MRGKKFTQEDYMRMYMALKRAKAREAKAKKLTQQIIRAGGKLWLLFMNTNNGR